LEQRETGSNKGKNDESTRVDKTQWQVLKRWLQLSSLCANQATVYFSRGNKTPRSLIVE